MTEISLTRLAAAKVEREPFEWVYVEETFDSFDACRRLMRGFPDSEFRHLDSRSEGKQYSMSGRSATSAIDGLTEEWRGLLCSLEAESYRRALGTLLGIDLSDLREEITLWRYCAGDYLGPHTDKEDKIVTHIFYFSEPDWSAAHGGCLDILAGEEPTAVVRRIVPICGRSVVLVRSDRSWHAVTPQTRPGYDRRAMQVVFHRAGLSYSRDLRAGTMGSEA